MVQRFGWAVLAIMLVCMAFAQTAHAQDDAEAKLDFTLRTKAAAMPIGTADGSALESPASHIMLVDYDTASVLVEKASSEPMYPSSMTKMMTLYVIFEKLNEGTLTLSNEFTVSEKAWRMQGSKMFVPLGGQIPLEDLIRGIAIQSGNDACMVVAEGISGSEPAFAAVMNETAKRLGMTHTHFVDGSGWPNPDHLTTAHDLAVLGIALVRDFPQYYHYFSEKEFTFHGIRQFNRNLLLNNVAMQVDGLKTGHTDAAGYGITLSAKDPATGRRQVLVINGMNSEGDRAAEGERLLLWGFRNFDNLTLFKAGQTIGKTGVWMGEKREVNLVSAQDIVLSVPKLGRDKIAMTVETQSPLPAPIEGEKPLGTLKITMPNGSVQEFPLVAQAPVAKLSFFGKIPRAFGF